MGSDPDMSMFVAVVNGDRAGVAAALAALADIERPEPASKMRPLGWAARMGHAGCVEELLAAGADPWMAGEGAGSAISIAMEHGQWAMVEKLVEGCPDPSMMDEEALKAAFMVAAMQANIPAMKLFIKQGIDIDAPGAAPDSGSFSEDNVLAASVAQENEPALRALLSIGADPSAVFGKEGRERCAAIVAIEFHWLTGLRILMDAGADPEGPRKGRPLAWILAAQPASAGQAEMLGILERAGAKVASQELGGELLRQAAWKDNEEVVRWLCERGVDPAAPVPGEALNALDVARQYPDDEWSKVIVGCARMLQERREVAAGAGEGAASTKPKRRV